MTIQTGEVPIAAATLMFKETPIRSIVKAVSWRVLATLTTGLLVYAFTRRLDIAFTVGALEAVAKLLLYFLHERLWNRLGFGRLTVNEVQVADPDRRVGEGREGPGSR